MALSVVQLVVELKHKTRIVTAQNIQCGDCQAQDSEIRHTDSRKRKYVVQTSLIA